MKCDLAATLGARSTRIDAAVEAIKRLIADQHLTPGTPLPGEATLASQLGVSRSSVREALGRLQALDIVTVRRGAGAFVGGMTWAPIVECLAFRALANAENRDSTVKEIMQMRRIIDVGLAAQVCQAARGTRQLGLHVLADEMVAAAKRGEYNLQLDFAFHDGLLALAGNDIARELMQSLWKVYSQLTSAIIEIPEHKLLSVALSHRELVEAAECGNSEKYVSILLSHYGARERFGG